MTGGSLSFHTSVSLFFQKEFCYTGTGSTQSRANYFPIAKVTHSKGLTIKLSFSFTFKPGPQYSDSVLGTEPELWAPL